MLRIIKRFSIFIDMVIQPGSLKNRTVSSHWLSSGFAMDIRDHHVREIAMDQKMAQMRNVFIKGQYQDKC